MSYLRFIIPLVCTFTIGQSLPAQAPKAENPSNSSMHYGSYRASIRTRIGPRRTTKYWSITSLDSKKRQNRGQLILAGRTEEPGDKTFGIAIFEALDEAAARAFMQADPAVAGGLMTAELHPFAVALERKNP